MGCINPKLLPKLPKFLPDQAFDRGGVVETVYATDVDKGDTNELTKSTQNLTEEKSTTLTRNNADDQQPLPARKVAKYRTKFDPRVTAKYDIKALVGRGSYSRVVRVEHKTTKQPYAIKMIDRVLGKDVFETELAVLRRVRHEYIIRLIEVFESRDKVYMVMELATGGELFDRILAKGSFTERDATRVVQMVLSGLSYIHALGITHRDLKPENLLYYHPGHDSRILITDFGLSATRPRSGEEAFMTTTCGTPEYIAPEILACKPYTSQVDLWAVGVITYILLSGTMPFDEENRARLYRLILKVEFTFTAEAWKDVSAEAKDFIDHLLVLCPSDRLTAQQALKNAWLTTAAASSSNKNLQQNISKNLMDRHSTKNSTRSAKSCKSARSCKSLHTERRRVEAAELAELSRDPDLQAELESLATSSCEGQRHR